MSSPRICLLGTGSSIDRMPIDLDKYDLVCGINRIHLNKRFLKHIDVFFNNASPKDPVVAGAEKIFTANPDATIIYLPGNPEQHWPQMLKVKANVKKYGKDKVFSINTMRDFLLKHDNTNYFTGVLSLWFLCMMYPKARIDVFGFDFYYPGIMYSIGIDRYHGIKDHNVGINLSKFSWLLDTYNVRWFVENKVLERLRKQKLIT